jgi:molybdopterin converting factor small subunit
MRISVQYATQVKRAAGVGSETLEAPSPCGIADVVRLAAERRGEVLWKMLLDDAGRVQPSLLVFIGDRQIGRDESVSLREGDVVTIMAPISGG